MKTVREMAMPAGQSSYVPSGGRGHLNEGPRPEDTHSWSMSVIAVFHQLTFPPAYAVAFKFYGSRGTEHCFSIRRSVWSR